MVRPMGGCPAPGAADAEQFTDVAPVGAWNHELSAYSWGLRRPRLYDSALLRGFA